jgi:hypothetical protein
MNALTEAPAETAPDLRQTERETVERLASGRAKIQAELAKVIVGQREVIEQILFGFQKISKKENFSSRMLSPFLRISESENAPGIPL